MLERGVALVRVAVLHATRRLYLTVNRGGAYKWFDTAAAQQWSSSSAAKGKKEPKPVSKHHISCKGVVAIL